MRVDFGVVHYLTVPVLLDTTVIGWYVNSIFPAERKAVTYKYEPVPFLLLTMHTSMVGQGHNRHGHANVVCGSG